MKCRIRLIMKVSAKERGIQLIFPGRIGGMGKLYFYISNVFFSPYLISFLLTYNVIQFFKGRLIYIRMLCGQGKRINKKKKQKIIG